MDGYHLQCREFASLMEGVELALCLIAEELEVRAVHVAAAGWAGWVHTGLILLLLRLNGKPMLVMLPQELLHGAE